MHPGQDLKATEKGKGQVFENKSAQKSGGTKQGSSSYQAKKISGLGNPCPPSRSRVEKLIHGGATAKDGAEAL